MLTQDQEKEYSDLKEEVKEYLKYNKWHKRTYRFGRNAIIVVSIAFAIDYLFLRTGLAPYFLFAFFALAVFLLISDNALEKLAERNTPSADRLAAFYVYATIDNLDRYFDPRKSDTKQRKTNFRRKAAECSKELLIIIEKNWTIGKFGLGEKVLGKNITDFKELLSKRLVPTVKEGDAETYLRKANEILWQFSVLLHSTPTIELLNRISKHLAEDLPEIPITKEGFANKLLTFLRGHSLLPHVFSILGIFGSAGLVYYAGINYIGMTPDSAYNTSVQFLGIMIVGYITITLTILARRKE